MVNDNKQPVIIPNSIDNEAVWVIDFTGSIPLLKSNITDNKPTIAVIPRRALIHLSIVFCLLLCLVSVLKQPLITISNVDKAPADAIAFAHPTDERFFTTFPRITIRIPMPSTNVTIEPKLKFLENDLPIVRNNKLNIPRTTIIAVPPCFNSLSGIVPKNLTVKATASNATARPLN